MKHDFLVERRSMTSDPTEFRDAREWLGTLARDHGFAADARSLTLALSEACANAHRHGYRGRTDGKIDLEVRVEREALYVTVRHYGETFDPSAYTPPEFDKLPESGYGIYLIRELMDEVSYTNTEAGTQVVMVKRHRSLMPGRA